MASNFGRLRLIVKRIGMILATVFFATSAGFGIHVLYGRGFAVEYAEAAAKAGYMGQVLKEPYPYWVVLIAFITALIPTFGKVVAFLFIYPQLPGESPWKKGLMFAGIMLLADDDLIRQPLMNIVVGVPLDVAVIRAVESWLIWAVTGLLIGNFMLPKNTTIPRVRTFSNRE